ncbi:MAG: phosphoglycerate kinase [Candidatus Omnitrophica bacterium]|nr:phosphoglycerate kinase [Candidatus Omnitrophota bacterium]
MDRLTISDIALKNKRVLIRVDFNVPLDKQLLITDDKRIQAALPTINYCLKEKATVILMTHLGRPDGKVVEEMRLKPVAARLGELLNRKITYLPDCTGSDVEDTLKNVKPGEVALLENLRFHPEEEKNDDSFSRKLAALGDIYVNDAFGTAHRAHASTAGIAKYLPAVAGFLMEKEIEYLGRVTANPERPLVAILGGAKVSDKIAVLENLITKVDAILIGGGMAYTFLKARGRQIGNSKLEKERVEFAKNILEKSEKKGAKIYLPVDHIVAREVKDGVETRTVPIDIPEGWLGLDVGPKTIDIFKESLKGAKTIVWNGPLGVFEISSFERGTREIAVFISSLKATTIIGGGDTAAAILKFGLESKMSHVSTGGGASLEFLEGKPLPGIAVLKKRNP